MEMFLQVLKWIVLEIATLLLDQGFQSTHACFRPGTAISNRWTNMKIFLILKLFVLEISRSLSLNQVEWAVEKWKVCTFGAKMFSLSLTLLFIVSETLRAWNEIYILKDALLMLFWQFITNQFQLPLKWRLKPEDWNLPRNRVTESKGEGWVSQIDAWKITWKCTIFIFIKQVPFTSTQHGLLETIQKSSRVPDCKVVFQCEKGKNHFPFWISGSKPEAWMENRSRTVSWIHVVSILRPFPIGWPCVCLLAYSLTSKSRWS